MEPGQVERNRARQAELYGAPLGDHVKDVVDALGLTQSRLADVLGLSAPMLSQLVHAQRVKIGNPAVVQRLRDLGELAEEVRHGLPTAQVEPRLSHIQDSVTTMSAPRPRAATEDAVPDPVRLIRSFLRAVASGRDLLGAAQQLAEDYPELAEVLRMYGTGTREEATAHYRSIQQLLEVASSPESVGGSP